MALAGSRRPSREDGLLVDYKDVLEQAVANERHRVLREVRERVEKLKTTRPGSGSRSWDTEARKAEEFKKDVLREIDNTEECS
jgi:hypothetical protein